jgi:hypothetical protein
MTPTPYVEYHTSSKTSHVQLALTSIYIYVTACKLTELALIMIGAPLQSCIGCTAGGTCLLLMSLLVAAALMPLAVTGSSSRSYGNTMTAC